MTYFGQPDLGLGGGSSYYYRRTVRRTVIRGNFNLGGIGCINPWQQHNHCGHNHGLGFCGLPSVLPQGFGCGHQHHNPCLPFGGFFRNLFHQIRHGLGCGHHHHHNPCGPFGGVLQAAQPGLGAY